VCDQHPRARARTFPAVNVGSSPDSDRSAGIRTRIDSKSLQDHRRQGLLVIAGERNRDTSSDAEKQNVYAQERFAGRSAASSPAR
jgi:HSP20 family protein